jgi:hypothetical protein
VRRRDASVRIVDKEPSIREISKALIWHVRTQEAIRPDGYVGLGGAGYDPERVASYPDALGVVSSVA